MPTPYRVVVEGVSESGKSNLLIRWTMGKQADERYTETVGSDYYCINNADKTMRIDCIDCSGNKRHQVFHRSLRFSMAISVYCVDLSKPLVFPELSAHLKMLHSDHPTASLIVVGTKSDLDLEGKNFAALQRAINLSSVRLTPVIRTSALTGEGTDELNTKVMEIVASKQLSKPSREMAAPVVRPKKSNNPSPSILSYVPRATFLLGLVAFTTLALVCAFVPAALTAFSVILPFLLTLATVPAAFSVAGIFGGGLMLLGVLMYGVQKRNESRGKLVAGVIRLDDPDLSVRPSLLDGFSAAPAPIQSARFGGGPIPRNVPENASGSASALSNAPF